MLSDLAEAPENDERRSNLDGGLNTEKDESARRGLSAKDDGDDAFSGAIEHADDGNGKSVLLETMVWCWHCVLYSFGGRIGA